MDREVVIGIDIGGTNFRIGQVDRSGELSDFRKAPVSEVLCAQSPLEDMEGYLRRYIDETCGGARVLAVSIGFPATVDRERRRVLQAPNLSMLDGLPVVEHLTDALGLSIYIANDVEMALAHDMELFQIPAGSTVCGFYFGTGVGNAIVIKGEYLEGKNGAAGELGHIPVDGNTQQCGCGNVGCIENLAGGKYLSQLCREVYTDTKIQDIFTEHAGEELIDQYVDRVAMAIATEVNILDPDYALVGGGVLAMNDFPKELLVKKIRERARKPFPAENLEIIFTGDPQEKCVVGAARYAFAKGAGG